MVHRSIHGVANASSMRFFVDAMASPMDNRDLSPWTSAGQVLMGNCGWSDERAPWSCKGRTAIDKLALYVKHFGCVEVDTSTYAIPSLYDGVRIWVYGWVEAL